MVDVTTQIDIARPRADVAAYASNPDNATTWYVRIKSVEWKTPKPLQVGSRVAFVAQFLGRTLEYIYEVKEMAAGERFVMATAQGPFPMETTYTWEDTSSGGTRRRCAIAGSGPAFRSWCHRRWPEPCDGPTPRISSNSRRSWRPVA